VTGLEGLALSDLEPRTLLPGSRVTFIGKSFVDPGLGTARARFSGQVAGRGVDVEVPLTYDDAAHLEFSADIDQLGGVGAFHGQVQLVFDSLIDGQPHAAPAVSADLMFARELSPRFDREIFEPLFVNDPVGASGDGFLLGGREGETRAVVSGCFQPQAGGSCAPVAELEIPARPVQPFDRTQSTFPYATAISGIAPGSFMGMVKLRNVLPGGTTRESESRPVSWHIGRPMVAQASPQAASLGQYVFVRGAGFVGGQPDELTLLRLDGHFRSAQGGNPVQVTVTLVPEFVDGQTVRYVLDEADAVGRLVNLRTAAGHFSGQMTPTVRKGSIALDGDPGPIEFDLAHVKQVVWVRFLDSYRASLRRFGLFGVDSLIRTRIFEICKRDYQGVNIEFRAEQPQDFALYSTVDIGGPDPNDLGLLGYDNTPGKDTGNMRLFDQLGGVNAQTQQDGFPGYGGIFSEMFLGFSEHPSGVKRLPTPTPLFDQIFDPFRSDQGGLAVTALDLTAGPAQVRDGSMCPAQDRMAQLGCAIFVLGNLVGTTLTHEVGHSLGLANPYGDGYHDPGDAPDRLMDAGGARPFEERSELHGQGPAVFCDTEFDYLRNSILQGSPDPDPQIARPPCQ